MKVKNMDEAKKFYKDFLGLEELRTLKDFTRKQKNTACPIQNLRLWGEIWSVFLLSVLTE